MKILLTITLSLLLFSCDNSVIGFKKSCNAETAKQTVAELAEVITKPIIVCDCSTNCRIPMCISILL